MKKKEKIKEIFLNKINNLIEDKKDKKREKKRNETRKMRERRNYELNLIFVYISI